MDGGTVTFKFVGDTSNLEKSTKNVSSSVGDIIKGSLASKVIVKGIQAVTSNLGDAIQRVDQLNQFPKVMNSLGISTEDANKALKQVDESILGLPTTLNQAAQGVQRLTAKNGDVKLSATYFTAMNDAILSGTNDTTLYNSALEQMMQAYSKGKPDLIEFRSWVTAMPGQMKQVAQAMGYISTDDLYNAFKNGSVSMEDFMNTLVKLDTEGAGDFASFSKQAKANTDGIETSITNLKTAIARGLANSFQALNDSLKNNNLPTISEMIQNVSKHITDFSAKIIPVITFLVEHRDVFIPLATGLLTFVAAVKAGIGVVTLMNTTMTLTGGPIVWIIGLIAGVVVALVTLYNKCEWFRSGINEKFWEFINWVSSIPGKILGFFTSLPGQMSNIGRNIIQGLTNGIRNMIGSVGNAVKSVADKITSTFKKILHIGSPSRVFFDYGKFTDEGYINGIDKMAPQIQESLKNMVDLSPTLTGTTSTNLSPNIVVNNDMAFETDPLGQVVKKIKTYSGGSKNDYNYGMGV